MKTTRRNILKAAGAGIVSMSLPLPAGFVQSAFAGEGKKPTLVILYLRGGMDALNVIVPYKDKRYYDLRPTLAVPREGTDGKPGIIPLDSEFGLHPAFASLKPFWDAKRFAPVVNVGSPHPTRSHFDAQDFMEYAAPGMRTVRDGWLNRYLAVTDPDAGKRTKQQEASLRALAMQGLLPRSLRGRYPVIAVPERNVLKDEKTLKMFGELYGEEDAPEFDEMGGARGGPGGRVAETDGVLRAGRYTAETLERLKKIIERKEARAASKYPASPLGAKLRAISQVIRSGEGLEVAALDINGWDTHANQGLHEGAMPRLMQDLGDSVAAFLNDLGEHLDSTLVVTMTEFGRTCKENGNFGTDHGHGGAMFLLGGGVKGGKVHGKWTGLGERDMYQARDLKVTTDFRDVFGQILQEHFRFKAKKGFFPGYRHSPVRGLWA
ncbi:MAG: DUF1501 domain-containing protein [Planctomycetota bacterium]|jgi:uncharacterized protein (DUF1501 family)